MQNLNGLIGAIKYISTHMKTERIMTILYYDIGASSFYTFFGWILSRWLKVPFVGESTEEPFIYVKNSLWKWIRKTIFWKFTIKLPDGIIVISQHLKDKFARATRRCVPIELIPVIVDVNRFTNRIPDKSKTVTFVGSLSHDDEIDLLLEAWSDIWTDFREFHLCIVGSAPSHRLKTLKEKVDYFGLKDGVTFTGLVERNLIPNLLQNSTALVLPRPSGLYSKAGLPNKLGEYLASYRPVICTSVGDIPLYLTDGENAFLVEPGNIRMFSEKLRFVLRNKDDAIRVGIRGRLVAEEEFSMEKNCRRLIEFFQRLLILSK